MTLLRTLLAATALVTAPALAAPAVAAPNTWPQAASDLPADPAVRFGVLPNGMAYAVMRNATPAHATSIRFRIGSGSLEESDAEQGLAHVLEHMAFKGSKHVAAGDMIKMLQRLGLGFGADTNAQTGWTQTVYEFDLPHSDRESLDTGLMLMREIASELTLDPKALDAERGVVLSEERLRDTPQYRAQKAQLDLFLHGQLAARRFPIGQVDVIEHAPVSLVRKFYEDNYRPDRATLIVVGDFDPAAMEAEIRARFGDWRPAATAGAGSKARRRGGAGGHGEAGADPWRRLRGRDRLGPALRLFAGHRREGKAGGDREPRHRGSQPPPRPPVAVPRAAVPERPVRLSEPVPFREDRRPADDRRPRRLARGAFRHRLGGPAPGGRRREPG